MWFTVQDNLLYNKYKDVANEKFNKNRFSTKNILSLAKEANFIEDAINEIASFCEVLEKDQDLQRYINTLYYIAYESGETLTGREYRFNMPKSLEVEEKYLGMAETIIGLLAVEYFYNYVETKKLLDYIDKKSYNEKIKKWSEENKIKNGTYALVDWGYFRHQYATGQILRIGRLVFEKKYPQEIMEVYKKGDKYIKIALPDAKYDNNGYMIANMYDGINPYYKLENNILSCQTFNSDGLLENDIIKLDLNEYELFINKQTPVLNIHIPDGDIAGPLYKNLVDDALNLSKIVIKKENVFKPKAFTCGTWMLSPQLKKIISPNSNMYNFADRFDCVESYINEYSLFGHIFHTTKCPIEELVPVNNFQQRILDMVKSNKPLRNGYGYIKEDF